MVAARWLVLTKRSRVSHLIDEETTGWTQTERRGALIALCRCEGNERYAERPGAGHRRCVRCMEASGETVPLESSDPLRDNIRDIIKRYKEDSTCTELIAEIEAVL